MAAQSPPSAIHALLETYPDADEYATHSMEWTHHVEPAIDLWIETFQADRFRDKGHAMCILRRTFLAAHCLGIDEGRRRWEDLTVLDPVLQHKDRVRAPQLPVLASMWGD